MFDNPTPYCYPHCDTCSFGSSTLKPVVCIFCRIFIYFCLCFSSIKRISSYAHFNTVPTMRDIYYMSGIQAAMCVSTTRFNLKFVYKLITLKLIQKRIYCEILLPICVLQNPIYPPHWSKKSRSILVHVVTVLFFQYCGHVRELHFLKITVKIIWTKIVSTFPPSTIYVCTIVIVCVFPSSLTNPNAFPAGSFSFAFLWRSKKFNARKCRSGNYQETLNLLHNHYTAQVFSSNLLKHLRSIELANYLGFNLNWCP